MPPKKGFINFFKKNRIARHWAARFDRKSMSRPIVFFMTDQQRADHVGFLPGARVATPNLDVLAESCAFSDCLAVNPVCGPMRSALLTGKYSHQIGLMNNSGDLSRQHPTYLRALLGAGYHTAAAGKLHWISGWAGGEWPRGGAYDLPRMKEDILAYGLDDLWEASGKGNAIENNDDYTDYLEGLGLLDAYRDHAVSRAFHKEAQQIVRVNYPNLEVDSAEPFPLGDEHYVDAVIAREAIRLIRERPKDKPFYLFVSFCGPHPFYDPPKRFLDTEPEEPEDSPFVPDAEGNLPQGSKRRHLLKLRRSYRAMIRAIDHYTGEILDVLKEEGLFDEAMLCFASDHGEMLGDHQAMSKSQPWKESANVPLGFRHPDCLRGATNASPVELTDLTATILDAAGIDPREALSRPRPGYHNRVPCRSLLPVVRGEVEKVRDFAFSEGMGGWKMVQDAEWKYIRYPRPEPGPAVEALYDRRNDPGENRNRAGDPELAEVLQKQCDRLDWVLENTPPAQLRWAPLPGETTRPTVG